jgi:hypothetical protein
MRVGGPFTLCGVAWLVACGGSSNSPKSQGAGDQAASAGEQCNLLTTADVQAVTGAGVERVERNAAIGAGGTCVNFAADGRVYLGVNQLKSAGDYEASVSAVPEDVYPTKQPLELGDEAVLFKGPGGLRYLVAREGASGVVLFPMGEGVSMSDDQLRDLAAKALTASQ